MKTGASFALFVCFVLLVSTGLWGQTGTATTEKSATVRSTTPVVEGKITRINGNRVTLAQDNGQSVTLAVKQTTGFKVGDRVKIQDGTLTALVPIPMPNTPNAAGGSKAPSSPEGAKPTEGHATLPVPLPIPAGTITQISGSSIRLRDAQGKEATFQVRNAQELKVGDRVKIQGGYAVIVKVPK